MFTTERPCLNLEQLRQVPVTAPPGAGKIWQGVQHGQLADKLIDHARSVGLDADRRGAQFWTTKDGGDAAGLIPVNLPSKSLPASEKELERRDLLPYFGFVASNRQETALTVFCGALDRGTGARVIPSCMKQPREKRWAYTVNFDFDFVTSEAWGWWDRKLVEVWETWDRLTSAPVSSGRLTNLLVAVGRREILPWSRVGTADRAFLSINRDKAEQDVGLPSHYDFLAACAAPLSLSSPIDQLVYGHKLTDYLNRTVSKKSRV